MSKGFAPKDHSAVLGGFQLPAPAPIAGHAALKSGRGAKHMLGSTREALEKGEVCDVLSDFISGQKALRWFIFAMNEEGDGWHRDVKDGLFFLQGQQDELLESILSCVERKDALLEEYRAEIDSRSKSAELPTPRAKSLRDEFIAAKAREGVDAGDIASAMNMKRTSIERVIRQLQGQEPHSPGQAAHG